MLLRTVINIALLGVLFILIDYFSADKDDVRAQVLKPVILKPVEKPMQPASVVQEVPMPPKPDKEYVSMFGKDKVISFSALEF